jgi:cell division protein FtsW
VLRTQTRSPQLEKQAVAENPIVGLDKLLLFSAASLMMLGLVMITSASLDYANHRHAAPLHYFFRHAIYLLLALSVAAVVYSRSMQFWEQYSGYMLFAAFALLLLILIPGVGYTANNATRWLALGPITIQISEIVKIAVVAYLSSYLVRQTELVKSHFSGFLNPMLVIMALVVCLLMQPNFGAVVVLLAASLGMLFLGGVRIGQFALVVLGALGAVITMVVTAEYRMKRLYAYLDPWADQNGGGYQLVQSLIAFGRGEWSGLGLGNSIQKQFFLPEAHTDFIFAVVAEELGLLGCLLTLALYALMIGRILWIARCAEIQHRAFSAYMAYGISIIFAVQLFINAGVSIGLLPTKGLTLPFLSYGGSSLIVSTLFVAVALRIHYETQRDASEQSSRQGSVALNQVDRDVTKKTAALTMRGESV